MSTAALTDRARRALLRISEALLRARGVERLTLLAEALEEVAQRTEHFVDKPEEGRAP